VKKREKWEPINLAELFLTSAELYADREALKYKVGHHYESLTYFELLEEAEKLAFALKELGIEKGDRALLISENRPEWVLSDLALLLLGAVNVPVHIVLSTKQLEEIIEEINPKIIFFSDGDTENKLLEISETINKVDYLISYENINNDNFEKLKYFKHLIDSVKLTETDRAELAKNALKIKPENLATIIYTSGTSGHLKGVMLSHKNFVQNMVGILGNIWAYPEDRFYSVLPLSHVFERTAGYYVPMYCGSSIGYSIDVANISKEIQERKPTIVIAVPRLFEKIYEKVLDNVQASPIKKLIFDIAFKLKKENKFYPLFDMLVFKKIRDNFGGEIRFFVSGGATLPAKLGRFFDKVGMVILEGYGLTETSPVVAVNRLDAYRFGTVGIVLKNIEVKISDEGEILVKGPSVMEGYLRDGDNKEAMTKDGWFKTGDLGRFDANGFLVVAGRKKDLIVLTTGKKLAPVPIEEALESSEFIDQAFVFGEARKHIGALIYPNYEKLGERFGISGKEKVKNDPKTMELISKEASRLTDRFASYERIKKFVIIDKPFTIEDGEMTPTLKLRRFIIEEKNLDNIEKLYTNVN
jgi:long-chain acyl-CoA synthetase